MELLSILNPTIIDGLNDPRVTSDGLLKTIRETDKTFLENMKALGQQVKPGDANSFDLLMFAHLQQHLLVTTLNTKLTARQMDLTYKMTHLNLTLERLTKWLIGFTIAVAALTLILATDVVWKWFH